MSCNKVNVQFIGIDGEILCTHEFPKQSALFCLTKDNMHSLHPTWVLQGDNYDTFAIFEEEFMQKLHYIKGISQLRRLKIFWLTREPLPDSVLLRFDKWPEAEYILTNTDVLRLPYVISPFKSSADILRDEMKTFCSSFVFLHRKLVEVAMAFLSIDIPNYIVLWICDFLPLLHNVAEWKKMQVLTKIKEKTKII